MASSPPDDSWANRPAQPSLVSSVFLASRSAMPLAIVQENRESISASVSVASKLTSRRRRSKCPVACVHCRLRKVKCECEYVFLPRNAAG